MSRNLKFRVWNDTDKRWTHDPLSVRPFVDYLLHLNGEVTAYESKTYMLEALRLTDFVEDLTVVQYTDNKDVNGVEIYEGDIVNVNGMNRVVEWRQGGFYCTWSDYALNTVWFHGGSPKVVGNIFENPELIDTRK